MADLDFLNLPAGLIQWAEALPSARTYRAGEWIYREGQPAPCFYCLQEGKVRVFVTSGEGIEKNLTVYTTPVVLGEAAFFDGSPRMTSAQALAPSRIVTIRRENILTCFREQPDLALAMISSLSRTVRMLSDQINQIAFLSAEQRIADFLRKEGKENPEVPYTHEQIAAFVGVSRVTVSRILARFRKQGILTTRYGTIRLLDPEKLP